MENAVQGASSDRTSLTDEIRTLVANQVTNSIQSALPKLLKEALTAITPPQMVQPSQDLVNEGEPQLETPQINTCLARYYTEAKEAVLSE